MAARLIRGAKKVALYAVGDSYVTLQGFANLLLKIGIVTYSGNLNGDSVVATQILGPTDVAVIVTYSGGLVNKFAHEIQLLRSQGRKTILVTASAAYARASQASSACCSSQRVRPRVAVWQPTIPNHQYDSH
jgi:DNA-binding MurR/RpiR family transcriptional regulator